MKSMTKKIFPALIAFILLSTGVIAIYIYYAAAPKIPKEWLLGKTKEEVVIKVASVCKRPFDELIHIGYVEKVNNRWDNHYFKSIEEALANKWIMESDIWYIDHRTAMFVGTRFWRLIFKDNKVIEVLPWGTWG